LFLFLMYHADVICCASAQISKQVKVMLATPPLKPEWKK